MSLQHDPLNQVNYLQQILSQKDRNIGMLLAAGCPMSIKVKNGESTSPIIPDILGLTNIVTEKLNLNSELKPSYEIIQNHFKKDGIENPNIEKLLSHIRALRQVAGNDNVRGLTFEQLDKLEKGICEIISTVVDKSLNDTNTPYHQLSAWVGNYIRNTPIHLFTTNYDLLLEQALEDLRVPFFDGYVGSKQPFFDPHAIENENLPARWARLWKLHGSINWSQNSSGIVYRSGKSVPDENRRVIHPSHLKYDESRRMPFIAMMDRLKGFLNSPSAVLLICGYSFNDEHINSVLMDGLQGNASGAIFSLLYGNLENYPQAIKLAKRRGNLCLLSLNGAVIGARQGSWIEKDEPDENIHRASISWKSINNPPNSSKQAEFHLGDFSKFGEFLHSLVGPSQGLANV